MKKRKKIGRQRKFNRETLFPNKSVPEMTAIKNSVKKSFPCRFCQQSYLDNVIEEMDKLITIEESKVAIVDGDGRDLSKIYNLLVQMGHFRQTCFFDE